MKLSAHICSKDNQSGQVHCILLCINILYCFSNNNIIKIITIFVGILMTSCVGIIKIDVMAWEFISHLVVLIDLTLTKFTCGTVGAEIIYVSTASI